MRTTLDLDDDVLASAKEIARREGKTAGRVLSDLARRALTTPSQATMTEDLPARHGFRPFPAHGRVITDEFVSRLRDKGES